MKILFAVSEAAPFIKTGGLADVGGSLPAALARAGHEVKVILPLYQGIESRWRQEMVFRKCFWFSLAWRHSYCGIFELERDGVTYWFVDNEYYFKRAALYGHFDDGERFAFFSRAVLETPAQLDFSPDIIHSNDWQTALVPVLLPEEDLRPAQLKGTRTVFTIHNVEYQGRYNRDICEDVFGVDRDSIAGRLLEYHGENNLMKGAICAADFVTTVSPSYAEELKAGFWDHGMAPMIRPSAHKLRGILNGLDVELYNPAADPGLAAPFTPADLTGKAACKTALQQLLGLREDKNVPIVACVSRLVSHKGFDLVLSALDQIMELDIQMVVLGTGSWKYEEAFRQAEERYPGRFSAQIRYSAPLSTAIYGGADLFLMPSLSEPCGLSQMIAMRYGTVPIVRETGGLRDSVPPYDATADTGLGFTFARADWEDLLGAVRRAVELRHREPKAFAALRKRGMEADFSWAPSAQAYLDIYRKLKE